MRRRSLVLLALGSGPIAAPSTVLAQGVDRPSPPPPSTAPSAVPQQSLPPPLPPPEPAAAHQWVVLEGWIGAGATSAVDRSSTAKAALGATGLYHGDWLELGAGLTWQPDTTGLGTSDVIATLLAGVKVDPTPRLRLEVLAEGGVEYVSLGGGLGQTVDSGGTAIAPYVGGRVGVSFPLGRTRRTVIGWWMSGGAAIGPVTVNSVVTTCNSASVCSTAPQTDTIGGATWSTGLRFGGELWQW
jgi:hypothetical protein